MKYYKVLYNKKVIDVLDSLQFCRFQLKHKTIVLCEEKDAQGVLSSNGETLYHTSGQLPIDSDEFKIVTLEEIDMQEYKRFKLFNLSTPEEMAEQIILDLMERGMFV